MTMAKMPIVQQGDQLFSIAEANGFVNLKDFDDKSIAAAECELAIEGAVFQLKSDSQGLSEAVISRTAQNGTLQEYQCDHKLKVTVELDAAIGDSINQAHGI